MGMTRTSSAPDREQTFRSLYEAGYPDLMRFVQRRAHPDHAEDVVAEALLVVWRRLEELPRHHDDARAWVFGIGRNILLNNARSEQRSRSLGVRLTDATASSAARIDVDTDLVVSRVDLARAWALLSEVHQEALGLAVFEEMNAPQAAAVLNISPVAFRLRLSRARRSLRFHLDHLPRSVGMSTTAPGRTTTS